MACAIELATGKPTTKFVDFAMHRVNMLLRFGITPYLVFDGDRLPGKAATEKGRSDRRKESKAQGMELLKAGKIPRAYQELQKAIDITPEMARMLIDELKRHRVQYVVAPYEADSQMVYLERQGLVDAILSEDSDLLVFGAKCLLTKLDQYGECVMIRREDFTACREINLTGWTDTDFRCMAILSGCDYLDGIHKMGLKTAHRLVRKYKTIERVIRGAQWDGKFRIPPDYLRDYRQAETTFLYQWVFCPQARQLVHFTSPSSPDDVADLPHIGAFVEADIAIQVAAGDLNPNTKRKIIVSSGMGGTVRTPMHPGLASLDRSKSLDGGNSKSIESFFKPKRMPLAELSPNSFIPSPSQRQVLDRRGSESTWNPVNVTPSTTTPHAIRDSISRSVRSAPVREALVPRQPKRQRLCTDPIDTSAEAETSLPPVQRSRYFSSTAPGTSPFIRQSRPKKAQKNADFNLWSDDSLEGAMAELPVQEDTLRRSKKSKGIAVFSDVPSGLATPATPGEKELSVPEDRQQNVETAQETELPSPFTANLHRETQALKTRSLKERFKFSGVDWLVDKPANERDSNATAFPDGCEAIETVPNEFAASAKETVIEESPAKPAPVAELQHTYKLDAKLSLSSTLAGETANLKGSEDLLVPESDIGSPRTSPYPEAGEQQEQDSGFVEGSSPPLSPCIARYDKAEVADSDEEGEGVEKEVEVEDDGVMPVLDIRRFAYQQVSVEVGAAV